MIILRMATLLLFVTATNQQILSTEEHEHCGQYGFRCIDSESFQVCTYPDLDGQTEAPEPIRKCLDHNVCDEDNPAYCTPVDRIESESVVKPTEKCGKRVLSKRRSSNNVRTRNGFNNDEIEMETTTAETDTEDYPSFSNPKFECESFGYFPDIYNASMFWHCDHQNKGKGYIVRHMLCSSGRVFNPVHKECVMIGTTRNIRNDVGHSFETTYHHPEDSFQANRRPFNNIEPDLIFHFKNFSCRNRIPGKYPDKTNCRLYHYCLPKSFAPFNELTFLCPDRLAYDDDKETCNRISCERCAESLHPHESEMLHIEVDAIVLQKQKCKLDLRRHNPNPADCSEYHLCYNDKMVHLKCPDLYRFDENLLTCQPQHLVTCDY